MLRKFMIFSAFLIPLAAQAAVREAIVEVPAADVWSEPPKHPEKMSGDQRETQLLYGERVRIVETRGNVVRIEALEQPEYSHDKKWEGYPGWVEAIALKPAPDIKQAPSIVLSTWTSTMQPETMPDFYLPFGSFIRPGGKARDLYVIATPQGDRCLAMGSTRALPKEVKSIYREGLLQTARR